MPALQEPQSPSSQGSIRRIALPFVKDALRTLRRGDQFIYWTGYLPADRRGNKMLSQISFSLWRLSETTYLARSVYQRKTDPSGSCHVALFQKRNPTGQAFDYIARIIRQPAVSDIERAFRGDLR